MAFNPFDVFRRNQKILFAVLTVIVMFMFVLSFGQGDFFSQFPRWLASTRRSGPVVAEVDGSKVYSSELEQARIDRVLANQFMFAAAARGAETLSAYIKDGLSRATAENKPAFEGILRAVRSLPDIIRLSQNPNPMAQQYAQSLLQDRNQSYARIEDILAAPSPQRDDLELAQTARLLTSLTDLVTTSSRQHYFFNQPNDNNKDVMDFLLWKRKADRLGIRLDEAAAQRLTRDEFFDRLTTEDWRTAEDTIRTKQGYNPAGLRRALAEEFRVRAAQAAVLGTQALRADGRLADAPYDYYKFYREQTNTARYGLVTVPVDNYLDRVTGQPSESELMDLFRKARTVEPDPRLPAIGLKEPRRVKLGFVTISGDEPYYKTRAAASLATAEAVMTANSPANTSLAGLAGPAVLAGADGPLQKQYARYKLEHNGQVREGWGSPTPFRGGRPLDTHVLETVNVAALVAAFAAGGPLTAPAVLVSDGFASDRIAKIESLLPTMIAPAGPGIAGLAGVFGSAAGYDAFVRPLPLAAVRTTLLDRAREEEAQRLAGEDMTALGVELSKPNTKPADAEARVMAFAKERGLTVGNSTDLRDQFTLNADPGLKTLDARYQSDAVAGMGLNPNGYVDPLGFSLPFFYELDPNGGGQMRPSAGLYRPQMFPSDAMRGLSASRPAYLVWRTADQAAESPRTLDDPADPKKGWLLSAREKAVAGWKRLKARELARKEADELAKRAGTFGTSSVEIEMKLRDEQAKLAGQFASPEAKARVQFHEIDRVAPMISQFSLQAGRSVVTGFGVGESTFIPYPPRNRSMEAALLANRDKTPATAVVLADQPGDRLYVAVLEQKTDNSPDVFGLTVYGPTAQTPYNDLAREVAQQHQIAVRREIRERGVSLLKAEFRYGKESDELTKKSDSYAD